MGEKKRAYGHFFIHNNKVFYPDVSDLIHQSYKLITAYNPYRELGCWSYHISPTGIIFAVLREKSYSIVKSGWFGSKNVLEFITIVDFVVFKNQEEAHEHAFEILGGEEALSVFDPRDGKEIG